MKLGLSMIAGLGTNGDSESAVLSALFSTTDRHSVLGTFGFDKNGDTTLRSHGLYKLGPSGDPVFVETITPPTTEYGALPAGLFLRQPPCADWRPGATATADNRAPDWCAQWCGPYRPSRSGAVRAGPGQGVRLPRAPRLAIAPPVVSPARAKQWSTRPASASSAPRACAGPRSRISDPSFQPGSSRPD